MTLLRRPEGANWELLVIDNNSTDDTKKVVNDFKDRLPIRHIFEPKQGLSHARNRAIDEAKGDYIIWTDDDVIVDANWLIEYEKGMTKYPDAVFWGGPIEPFFGAKPPTWIQKNFHLFSSAYACRNFGKMEIRLDKQGMHPYGANMALKTEILRQFKYDYTLGRTGTEMISGEEAALFSQLFLNGAHGIWLPNAKVKHYIPGERLTRSYLKHYFKGLGRTLVRMQCKMPKSGQPHNQHIGYIFLKKSIKALVFLLSSWVIKPYNPNKGERFWIHGITALGEAQELREKIKGLHWHG